MKAQHAHHKRKTSKKEWGKEQYFLYTTRTAQKRAVHLQCWRIQKKGALVRRCAVWEWCAQESWEPFIKYITLISAFLVPNGGLLNAV